MFRAENMDDSPTTLYIMDGGAEVLTPEMLMERGLKEDRFRIDRKKLEDMMQVQAGHGNEAIENAEDFFENIMQQTSTQISWPSKLKIGAKSKKDPHVKIIGKPADVQLAKQMILKVLDTKKNRVTLKMDVSYSDHSYIIGKGGFKIQQVMEETGCHIHFPDSNRNEIAEKSNQVSIAGEAEGVETARSKIRELLPIVFTFELPKGAPVNPGDETNPALQQIQQTYSFTVAFRDIPGRVLVVVRGCQRHLSRLRQGLVFLMKCLTGSETIPVMGFMQTEIAVQHHSYVMGINECNLQAIMAKTGATIFFPNTLPRNNGTYPSNTIVSLGPSGPQILQNKLSKNGTHLSNSIVSLGPSGPQMQNKFSKNGSFTSSTYVSLGPSGPQILQNKSSVIIQGSFDSVCLAWQELLKCLPLVLMFDLKEAQDVDPLLVNRLMETYNISIIVRPKIRDNIKSVTLRGAERDSKILFHVRKEILGCDEGTIYDIEDSVSVSSVGTFSDFESVTAEQSYVDNQNYYDSDVGSRQSDFSMAESITLLTNIVQQNPQLLGILNSLTNSTAQIPLHSNHPTNLQQNQPYVNGTATSVKETPRFGAWGKRRPSDNRVLNYVQNCSSFLAPSSSNSSVSGDDADSGIFDSIRSGKMNGTSSQPESSASSTSSICNDHEDVSNALSKNLSHAKEFRNPNLSTLRTDYENRKILATKAMQQEITDNPRTPTTMWSGYGFSKSMPGFALKLARQSNKDESFSYDQYSKHSTDSESSPDSTTEQNRSPIEQVPSPFILSNFFDSIPQHQRQPTNIGYGSIANLKQLLGVFDLNQYYDLFCHNEIDLRTFLTLTDIDLQQLNICNAARKRMLGAIACMREPSRYGFSPRQFTAAPGAERRPLFMRNSTTDAQL